MRRTPASRWHWRDLFVDHKSGKLRETALWSNIGKTALTWAFVHYVQKGVATYEYWAAFGGIVVLHESAARFFNQRQQIIDKDKDLKP